MNYDVSQLDAMGDAEQARRRSLVASSEPAAPMVHWGDDDAMEREATPKVMEQGPSFSDDAGPVRRPSSGNSRVGTTSTISVAAFEKQMTQAAREGRLSEWNRDEGEFVPKRL